MCYDTVYIPKACAITMSLLVFGGLSLCKKALQAIGKYITQEVKNLHVHTHVFVSLLCKKKKQICCSSRALDTRGAECDSEEANVALLTKANQCMSKIPLTVAPQLIINSIFKTVFSMLAGVELGEVKTNSMEPLSDSHVLAGKTVLSQLTHPGD